MMGYNVARPRIVALSLILAATALGCDSGGGEGDDADNGMGGGPSGNMVMVDTMEDGDGYFFDHTYCWEGAWFTYGDPSAGAMITPVRDTDYMMTAVSPAREGSTFAANTVGSGFNEWGAGVGVNLRIFPTGGASAFPGENGECADSVNAGPDPAPYDAQAQGFTGVGFWAKADGPLSISFKIPTVEIVPKTRGGGCDNAAFTCDDAFEKDFNLTAEWQYFSVTWSDLNQEGWGMTATFEPSNIYGFQWQVGMGATFNFWVDDVHFLTE